MAEKRQKYGGRVKGTPNKLTALTKGMMQMWIEAHCATPDGEDLPMIMQDFALMDPRDRVKVTAEFAKIIMPKQVNLDEGSMKVTIEDKLKDLSGDE